MSISMFVAALLIAQTQATQRNSRRLDFGDGIVEAVVQSAVIDGGVTLGKARVEKVFTGKMRIEGLEFVIPSVVDDFARGAFRSNKIYPPLEFGERLVCRVIQNDGELHFVFVDDDYLCGIKLPQRKKHDERFEELRKVLIDVERIESGPDDEAFKLLKDYILSPNLHFFYWSIGRVARFCEERPAMVQKLVHMLRGLLDDPATPTFKLLYIDAALAANDGSWRRSDERIEFMIRLISNGFSDETKTVDQKFDQTLEERFSGNFSNSRFELNDALKLLEALLNNKQFSKKQRATIARLDLVDESDLEPLLLILNESSDQELRWFAARNAARNLSGGRLNDKQMQDIQQVLNTEKDLDIRLILEHAMKSAAAVAGSSDAKNESD